VNERQAFGLDDENERPDELDAVGLDEEESDEPE
jgi:hypothetical protein